MRNAAFHVSCTELVSVQYMGKTAICALDFEKFVREWRWGAMGKAAAYSV